MKDLFMVVMLIILFWMAFMAELFGSPYTDYIMIAGVSWMFVAMFVYRKRLF
ncbi:MAG: hypothetical protein ACRCXX_11595 [Cetobacterium sp.]|uniref:hypothetical protein n=1 Tax=Cetobacterium sp. TaxID=2071632 RepID=UPI003F38DB9C